MNGDRLVSTHRRSRRVFFCEGMLCLAGLGNGSLLAADADRRPSLRAGLMTDLHYADKEPAGTRFYREALAKLDEAVAIMNRARTAPTVQLGDFIDQASSVEKEVEWLHSIEARFARHACPVTMCWATTASAR